MENYPIPYYASDLFVIVPIAAVLLIAVYGTARKRGW